MAADGDYRKTMWLAVVIGLLAPCAGIGLLLGYVALASDRGLSFVLVNNSGHALTAQSGRRSCNLDIESTGKLVPSGPGRRLSIETDGATWEYTWVPFDREHVVRTFRRHLVYLQIEPDGSIFLVPFAVSHPVRDLPPQPLGYPLRPVVKKL
jgi:hypothetical protein